MDKTIKPGTRGTRAFAAERAGIDDDARTVSLAFSSETPYERFWGIEILDHAPGSIRLGRLQAKGPLLNGLPGKLAKGLHLLGGRGIGATVHYRVAQGAVSHQEGGV